MDKQRVNDSPDKHTNGLEMSLGKTIKYPCKRPCPYGWQANLKQATLAIIKYPHTKARFNAFQASRPAVRTAAHKAFSSC